jgi:hypothetical protein
MVEMKLSHTASGVLSNPPNIMNGEQSDANCLSHGSAEDLLLNFQNPVIYK